MNHYANGSIGDWMYRKIGGTNQLEAGYHRFYVKPQFVRGIEEARTELRFTLDSTLGESSLWESRCLTRWCRS